VDEESIGHRLKVLVRNPQAGDGGEANHIDESIGHRLKVLVRNPQAGDGGEANHIDRGERCHDCIPPGPQRLGQNRWTEL